MKSPEQFFWIAGSLWLISLALADFASDGTQRPFLLALLLFGGGMLWLLTEWRVRGAALNHQRRRRR